MVLSRSGTIDAS
jgi:hypothetical protein